ncbi:MAG: DNA polymerase III subunit beta [Peptococcaceae bacterium]|nr:DNA polymerase III subunit beta [Peptococcaceae bacterium]
MQITTTKEVLESAAFAAYRAVNPKNPLVILSGVLLTAKGEQLSITGSDLEVTITSTIPVEVIDEGSVVLPGRYFYELVRRLPEGPVHIETSEKEAKIKYGKQQASSSVFPAIEYPTIPEIEGRVVEVDAAELISGVKKVFFACVDNPGRPNLSGVYFNATPFGIEMTSTDLYRINWTYVQAEGEEGQAIIPKRALDEMVKVFRNGKLAITFGSSFVSFSDDKTTILVRVIEGKYPDINATMPVCHTKARVNRNELLDTLNRAALLTDKNNFSSVDILIKDGTLLIEACSETGTLSETHKCLHEGKNIEVSFNTRYLIESLEVCGSNATMVFSGPMNCIKFEETNYYSMILPLKKRSEAVA